MAGVHSASTIKGAATTRLIIRAKDNTTDPNSFISIFKFDVTKKERRYQLAESGTLSKTETNNLSSVEFKAKKYGTSSYLLLLEDLQPGEYGIVIGDPNNKNEKNSMKVTRRVNQQVQNYKTCLKNSRFGVEKFNFSLGLSFNFFCIDIILLSV